MFQADKKFKGDLHKSPWSIELSNRIKNLSYWRLVVSQLLTKVSHVERLSTLAKKTPTILHYDHFDYDWCIF